MEMLYISKLKKLYLIFLFGKSQQEIVADHLSQHCDVFAPCVADYAMAFQLLGATGIIITKNGLSC